MECFVDVIDAPLLTYCLLLFYFFHFHEIYVGPVLLNYVSLKLILQIAVYLEFPRRRPEAAAVTASALFISVEFKSNVSECD